MCKPTMFALSFIHSGMKQTFFSSLFFLCTVIVVQFLQTGCANIIPPGGGPKDTLPPQLVAALPKEASTNFTGNKITLTFNEFVELKEITENLVVSPLPKNMPLVEHKLKNITIKLKDSLQPNTTYSINFGNAIVDVNEGNPFNNFTYVFSTGNAIDNKTLTGKAVLAETGKPDSTLIAALYTNIADTAVLKQKPNYITKINGQGVFTFKYLPAMQCRVYILPNDYTKRYDDSTKLFAFSNTIINTATDSTIETLYAFRQAKKAETPLASANNQTKDKKEKFLQYVTGLEGIKQSLTQPLTLVFTNPLQTIDTNNILLTDTNFTPIKNYNIQLTNSKTVQIQHNWQEQTKYRLVIPKTAITDSFNLRLEKNDTLKFETKKITDYGNVTFRVKNLDTTKPIVLLIYKDDMLVESIALNQKIIQKNLFTPGEFELYLLTDTNKNGKWDTGNFFQKIQPEIIKPLNRKLSVRPNWDNEVEITL